MSITATIEASDPVHQVSNEELDKAYLILCSYVCILHNKKMNLPNIFLLLLKDIRIMQLFKHLSDFDTDYDCLKYFLQRDPSLHKSKYIKKYIIERDGLV
jgi:hypothetical protein